MFKVFFPYRSWRKAPVWFRWFWSVTAANFISYIAASFLFGGTADNGKIENGTYFIGTNDHQYTQVSKAFFEINVVQSHILMGSMGVILLVGLVRLIHWFRLLDKKYDAEQGPWRPLK